MITLTERNKITKVILTTQDETVIRKIESIIFPTPAKSKKKQKIEKEVMLEWNEIPNEIKKSIEKSLKQAEAGHTIPHHEVMKKYRKWLKK